jgi:hypothetical protein
MLSQALFTNILLRVAVEWPALETISLFGDEGFSGLITQALEAGVIFKS